jgi:hypothetical protein
MRGRISRRLRQRGNIVGRGKETKRRMWRRQWGGEESEGAEEQEHRRRERGGTESQMTEQLWYVTFCFLL